MERQPRVKKQDRTGVWVSILVHFGALGVVLVILFTTDVGKEIRTRIIGALRDTSKPPPPPPPPPGPRVGQKNTDAPPPPPSASGRGKVDAPASAGGGFAVAERKEQKSGDSGPKQKVEQRAPPPPPKPPPVKPLQFAAAKTGIKELLVERQKSSAVVESFGTEQISKSGASDVSDIIGRISGASVAEGKFAVVRGLADRYTLTTFNGADIPSADPNRRAVQLDLFPAQFISKVDVSKTFTPDLPGGFAGGALNIVTRSFPEKPLATFSYGFSYNPQANLNDEFLMTDHGKYDWLAIDSGKRELPADAAATSPRDDPSNRNLPIKDSFGSRQMSPIADSSSLNQSGSFAFGDTTHLFGRRFGFLAGMNYKQEYSSYDDGTVTKYDQGGASSYTKTDKRSIIEYTWGSIVNLAYELHPDHQLGFNFVYVQTAEDEARRLHGKDKSLTLSDQEVATPPPSDQDQNFVDQSILRWTERNLTYYQVQGKHELPEVLGLRMDWVASKASTSQSEPDYRIFQYYASFEDPQNPFFQADGPSQPAKPTRLYRELNEDNNNFRMDWTLPVDSYNSQDNSLKGGFYYSKSEQTLFSRTFEILQNGNHPFTTSGDPASFLAASNNAYVSYKNFPANFDYDGQLTVKAWYGMGTWSATEWLRLVGGVRLESTDLSVDTFNTGTDTPGSAAIQQDDILPSVGTTFLIRSNLQLRAAWSKTVVRPTYREISNAQIYDVPQGRTILGNTDLTMSASENFDVRLEWYPRPGELISIGGFYKKIDDAIELSAITTDSSQVTYTNYPLATVYGFEIELRKEFRGVMGPGLDQFSLGFNYAFIKSIVDLTDIQRMNRDDFGDFSTERPMYDQPEFVINGDLTWDNFVSGTSITLNGGVTGRRLVLVGLGSPDEFEEPAPYLDVSISQKLGRRWKAKFSAKNLLDPVFETTQTWPSEGKLPIKSSTKGMSFGLSMSYEF